MSEARYVRIFADDQGESHFEDVAVDLKLVDFAPPATPIQVAALFPAEQCSFLSAPPDWDGKVPHPTPRRQVLITLSGEYEITNSSGVSRRFPVGSVLLLEDTTGKGHLSRTTSEYDFLLISIALPQ